MAIIFLQFLAAPKGKEIYNNPACCLTKQNEENIRNRPGKLSRSSVEIPQATLYDQRGVRER